jgi:hypothetical protein
MLCPFAPPSDGRSLVTSDRARRHGDAIVNGFAFIGNQLCIFQKPIAPNDKGLVSSNRYVSRWQTANVHNINVAEDQILKRAPSSETKGFTPNGSTLK